MSSIDHDDLEEALVNATAADDVYGGKSFRANVHSSPKPSAVRRFKRRVRALLELLPADLSVGELRELIGPLRKEREEETDDDLS